MSAEPMQKGQPRPVTSGDIMAALAKKYPAPAFALLEQVSNGTGWKSTRYCDAMAMSLWPSRGLELIGFEVKVSRSDWIRELKKPDKADELSRSCHRWYVVAPPATVDLAELPSKWGLLEFKAGKLYTTREAPLNDPAPPSWFLVAAILRRASETMVPRSAVETLADERAEELSNARAERETRERQRMQEMVDSLKAFEEASGIRIDNYNGKRLGEDLALLRTFDVARAKRQLTWQRNEVARVLSQLDKILTGDEEIGPE